MSVADGDGLPTKHSTTSQCSPGARGRCGTCFKANTLIAGVISLACMWAIVIGHTVSFESDEFTGGGVSDSPDVVEEACVDSSNRMTVTGLASLCF